MRAGGGPGSSGFRCSFAVKASILTAVTKRDGRGRIVFAFRALWSACQPQLGPVVIICAGCSTGSLYLGWTEVLFVRDGEVTAILRIDVRVCMGYCLLVNSYRVKLEKGARMSRVGQLCTILERRGCKMNVACLMHLHVWRLLHLWDLGCFVHQIPAVGRASLGVVYHNELGILESILTVLLQL